MAFERAFTRSFLAQKSMLLTSIVAYGHSTCVMICPSIAFRMLFAARWISGLLAYTFPSTGVGRYLSLRNCASDGPKNVVCNVSRRVVVGFLRENGPTTTREIIDAMKRQEIPVQAHIISRALRKSLAVCVEKIEIDGQQQSV